MEVDQRTHMSEEECTTPKCGITTALACPPTPKKKSAVVKKRAPPKNGYFQPPDLDVLFPMPTRRREACV
ncbi:hypothetical protein K2173_019388 [Erythroxylum novogranatense]|uniref:Cyclin-dependent protein kinase inhibitor SMR4 n=1 Tax=Erythroxylum novogranatense TaxID=1862640 RepID=A0AAV8UB98_9ROSI|nr:hypothetical protein K2173_019388 [Erythroxylum novogranatense]